VACWERYWTPQPRSPDHSSIGASGESSIDEAGAEGDPEQRSGAGQHRARQRRHLAVVHDHEGDPAPGVLQLVEESPDARFEGLGRHGSEERRGPHLVRHVRAGRAAADGVDPWQVDGGTPERVHDLIDVPLGIRLPRRVPGDLLAEDDLAVDHGCRLAIARTQVEADPAPVEMAPQGHGGLARGRELGFGHAHDLERGAEQLRTHERGIEHAGRLGGVMPGEGCDERPGSVDVDARPAPGPEEELAQALHRAMRGGLGWMARRVCPRLAMPHGTGGLLDGQRHPDPGAAGPDVVVQARPDEGHGPEPGIEGRRHPELARGVAHAAPSRAPPCTSNRTSSA
jgi:hypothetical protein